MKLTATSLKRLKGVDTRLVAVVMRAAEITTQPFQITEGVRTVERQRTLVARGASKTMRSRHLTGHAVDVVAMVGGRISWEFPLYLAIRDAMFAAAKELGIVLRWGADWDGDGDSKDETFVDSPHFELPRAVYGIHREAAPDEPPLAPALDKITDRAESRAARTLALGDRGAPVGQLQDDLKTLGHHDGRVDNVFGPRTAAAVQAFQRSVGLKADGVVGPNTRRALLAALVARARPT
jgi:peptidoglycan LD-endopeptidase CwlK